MFLQLPLALQAAALEWLGAFAFLPDFTWVQAYLVVFPMTLLVLYATGAIFGYVARRAFLMVS